MKIMKALASISRDRSKIVLGGEHQVRHWTKHFGVTQQELERAIERVGNSAAAVREELAFNPRLSRRKGQLWTRTDLKAAREISAAGFRRASAGPPATPSPKLKAS